VKLTRRSLIRIAGLTAAASSFPVLRPTPSAAQSPAAGKQWLHALSLFEEVKYPPGFKHFDYVNPNAPKGGVARQIAIGTFDNFNIVVSGVKGNVAAALEGFLYDTLMVGSLDEVSTEYGLLAETVSHAPDHSSAAYRLRANARWHDGKPITPADVIFSFEAFKKHHPQLSAYYRHVAKIEQTGEREITFTFDQPGNRELPLIVGQITVLPKHWWDGADGSGRKRDISATTLEPPLGCGAYRVRDFVPGRSISYERVKDYWGKDLNVNIGRDNFDELRFEYFRDSTVAIEAFKADHVDWRSENSAKDWETAYDFPAVREKRVVKEEFPIVHIGVMQAFVPNMRHDKFKDARVRRALNFAFDFEEMNKQIFFGRYKRISSYFEGTELASSGKPAGLELEILQAVRDQVPAELFDQVYTNPVAGSPDKVRANLREATRLLRDAGYEVRNQQLVNAKTGELFTIELLVSQPSSERFMLFYKPSLERLGFQVTVRRVDDAQYQNRLRSWDFDIITVVWGQSLSPGNEQRAYWSSQAADISGSRNFAGIKNPAVDKLIDRVIFAKNRAELVAATKALDRVLLWNHYVVPQWTYGKAMTARWDRFGRPDPLPKYGVSGFPTVWWWDATKAAKIGGRQ
jgi:microcin C transport system substrate-binding protein